MLMVEHGTIITGDARTALRGLESGSVHFGHIHVPSFVPCENIKHVVSVSGGKDSGATYLHALELLDGDFLAVCADTGNEHPDTLEYVERLHERTGGPKVQIIRADFSTDLARKKLFLESGKAIARTKNPWPQERVSSVLAHGLEICSMAHD